MGKKIQTWLAPYPENKQQLMLALRDLFLTTHSEITKGIKWNNLNFAHHKKDIAFIYTFPRVPYINEGFFRAVSLANPDKLFEGNGANMRHIKVYTLEQLHDQQICKWILDTIEIQNK